MYFFPRSSSRLHPVKRQNSVPTRQISPVRRQTTVGVPEKEMSLLSSTSVRWNVLSTNVCEEAISVGSRGSQVETNLVFLRERHLERDKGRAERCERANDA